MEEDGVGERQAQEQAYHHHDQLNEFAEETWSALGENLDSINAVIGRSTSSGNMQIWRDWEAEMQVAVGSMDAPGLPTAATSDVPIISEESIETYENKDFLNEEVDTLKSCSKEDVKPEGKDSTMNSNSEEAQTAVTSVVDQISQSSLKSHRSSFREFCRICHGTNINEKYISPCECKGTLSLVHRSCLERWLSQNNSSVCELCGESFQVVRIPKYGLVSSVVAWLRTSWRDRRNLFLDLIIFSVFCPLVSVTNVLGVRLSQLIDNEQQGEMLVTSSSNVNEELMMWQELGTLESLMKKTGQAGVISMVLTIDFAFAVWLLSTGQNHIRKWYSWYRRNCIVKLIGYPDIDISIKEEPSISSANKIRSISF